MESPLIIKSKQFALEIIKVCNKIKNKKRESILTNIYSLKKLVIRENM